jgi:hypothetical protein
VRWLPLALLLASTPAAADLAKPVRLIGKLDGSTARISARYTLAVGATWSESQAELDLPRDGLVTAARASLGGTTHELALLGAEAAQAKFQALAGDEAKPGAKTSAVLVEAGYGRTKISVASARAGTLVVDLELAVPSCFLREVRYVAVPASWKAIAGTTRKPSATDDELDVACGRPTEDRVWTGFASHDVARLPSGARVDVAGDRVDLGGETFARVELGLANVLADIPRDLATVLVIDNSRSLGPDEQAAQRELVQAYLKRVPSSRVQVVAFARHAQPLLSGWMNAGSTAATVDQALARLVPQNGSNFDAGLAEAATWLRKLEGTRRVVLITDELMADRLQSTTAPTLKQLLPAGTLVHVVIPDPSPGTHLRDDDGRLAPLAAATEGMRMRIGAAEAAPLDATRLVRPTSLDDLAITAPGWTALTAQDREQACENELSLDEGGACTWWGKSTSRQPITIEGKIWGKLFMRVVTPSLARATDLVRQLSTHPVLPAELRDLADQQARAVNSKWSLYAAWGGPGTYEVHGAGGSSATCGCDGPGSIGHGGATGHGTIGTLPQIDLRTQLADQLATCKLGSERVQVKVELTWAEIVDVHVTARQPDHARCVAEVVWASAPQIHQRVPYQTVEFVAGG